jgi:hypothetical protein
VAETMKNPQPARLHHFPWTQFSKSEENPAGFGRKNKKMPDTTRGLGRKTILIPKTRRELDTPT